MLSKKDGIEIYFLFLATIKRYKMTYIFSKNK